MGESVASRILKNDCGAEAPQTHAKNISYLDGWRGLAILLLLIGHFVPYPGINLGNAGVNLFFVLSGLLMAKILFIDAVSIPTFYRRRISRIFPPVFFFLGAVIIGYLLVGKPVSWAEAAAAATFLTNYFPGEPGAAVMPFGHIWSLCVEEHSYIVLSLITIAARARIINARAATGTVALICAAAGVTYSLTYHGQRLEFDRWIHSEVSAFGIFASAFLLLRFNAQRKSTLPMWIFPALIGFGLAMHWWSVPALFRTILGVSAFALAINLLDRAPKIVQSALSFRPLRQLGLWSFSIYLWQQPFYLYVHRNGMPAFLGLGCAILAGVASFYLLEKPARAYLNRRWTGSVPPATHNSIVAKIPAP
jgi:peptidoglycan/LPS O-acetylase OafA/YrhL